MFSFLLIHKWMRNNLLSLGITIISFVLALQLMPGSGFQNTLTNYQQRQIEQEKISFLNDRSASIIGSTPLVARGFLRPEGLTGAGQVVALADSGLGNGQIENPHPDLSSQPGQMPKVIMLKSWAGRQTAEDTNGHGTHMAATIAGDGAASKGQFAGIAPGASIYFQGILNPEGKLVPPTDIKKLFQPAYDAAARIHVNGWGGEKNAYLQSTANIDEFIRQHPDFLAIFGAGNNGPQEGTLTPEANSKNALVVGASEGVRPAFGPDEDNAAQVAGFSSRGPASDGRIKPDLVAPGSGIISAASPLIKSNFTENPLYTRMQGTSMAAAVVGGSAALLREYFQKEEGLAAPSSALLKAAMINGALPIPDSGAGFGRLDLASTVLALKNKSFLYKDKQGPLSQNDSRSYTFRVASATESIVATLCWIDPPTTPGSAKTLVNDLDLTVISPDGSVFFGNDTTLKGKKDDRNNVERIVIPNPKPGTYTIEVKAAKLTGALKAGASPSQDFALVFGQPLAREVISDIDKNNTIKFTSGKEISMPSTGKNTLGRYLIPWESKFIFPGENAYMTADRTNFYLAGDQWRSPSTKGLPLSAGFLLIEADPTRWEGGYYLNPRSRILANDRQIKDPLTLPGGIQVSGIVNPSSQSIWWLKSDYIIEKGIIRDVNSKDRRLSLIGRQESYSLAEEAAFSFIDSMTNSNIEDLPFGSPMPGTLEQLAPGMTVELVISPSDGKVRYIAVNRSLVTGEISFTDITHRQLILKGGKSFQVIDNAPVTIDGNQAQLNELQPGNHVILILAGETVISIAAESRVNYGQVVYFSSSENKLYLLDYRNRLHTYQLESQVQFFRWQQASDIGSLLPGEWVRVTLLPDNQYVYRIDVAEELEEQSGTFSAFNRTQGLATFSLARHGLVSSRTLIVKNGYPVRIEDILPGEQVSFTLLKTTEGNENIIASIKGSAGKFVTAPRLEATCRAEGNTIYLSGVAYSDYVYVYTEEGLSIEVKPEKSGQFSLSFKRPKGQTLQLVAVDRLNGGVTGMYLTIPKPIVFNDVKGNSAQKEIEALTEEGLLSGYPDGSFRPDQPVTRTEFIAMITRLLKTANDNNHEEQQAIITGQFPSWAQNAINLAFYYGIISCSPDESFNGDQPATGKEVVFSLEKVLEKYNNRLSGKEDGNKFFLINNIIKTVFQSASMTWNHSYYNLFLNSVLTRAEAALIMNQLHQIIPG